jgi:hypothetical protein
MILKKNKISNTVLDIIPIRYYDHANECFILSDKSVLDIVGIKCKDFNTASDSDIDNDMLALTRFFRTYVDDIKIISINIPTSCEEQIKFVNHKIAKCRNEFRRNQLEIKKAELEWIEKNRLNKEFYIMYQSKDIQDHIKHKDIIIEKLGNGNLLNMINEKEKEVVLMKMNNKNVKS